MSNKCEFQLFDAKTKEGLEAVFNECEWRLEIDGLPTSITLEDKESFVMQVAKYFTIIKCKPMLDQFIEGLKYFEVQYKISVCQKTSIPCEL